MKRIPFLLFFAFTSFIGFAQEEEETTTTKGFKKENIFVGGGINLGLSQGTFSAGILPEVGYTIAPWLDAGLAFNLNYTTIKAEYAYGYRQRSFNYGGGVFTRLYPVKFLFLQLQPEQNYLNTELYDPVSQFKQTYKEKATSFLGGIGYTNRVVGRSSFYMLLMVDLMRDINSPYRDATNSANPIFRTGFNIYLKPSQRR